MSSAQRAPISLRVSSELKNMIPNVIDSQLSRLTYIICKIYFALLRRFGIKPRLPFFLGLKIRLGNQEAKYYFRNQVDFDLLHDTFVTQEYSIPEKISPSIIFDLGSNIGATVIFFKLVYPNAIIYAFEPDPQNILHLKRNTAQFGKSVRIIKKAVVGSEMESVSFYQAKNLHWSSSIFERSEPQNMILVPATTIDQFVKEEGISNVDICKFDVEGSEYEIFKNLSHRPVFTWLVGELHPAIFRHTKEEFYKLLPEYSVFVERQGRIAIMKLK